MRLLAVLSILMFAGCVVGDPTPGRQGDDDQGASPDAGGDPGPDGGASDCAPVAASIPDGHHNAGQACLTCHAGQAAGAPTFTVAGTLYNSKAGTAGVPGATMKVTDASGASVTITTGNDGNFWSSQAVTLPLSVSASLCPDTKAMTAKPQTGDCNSCHTATATQGRIHVP